ncbi:MAG: serine/threonine-protein kinase [Polyangiales bacterium]
MGERSRKECPKCGERYPADFRVCPRDATELREANRADDDPLIGSVLAGDYEVLSVIGEGAMGRVYEARHLRLRSKRFAIKVLHGDLTRQPEVVERFLREAEATSVLTHPNIVGVLDMNYVPDGRPYLVAELLQGTQLGDYLQHRGKLPTAEAIDICRQICAALIAAHDKDIVHRDIKPENLFLLGEGERRLVKVLDFGISRVGDGAATLTKTGMVMGTPAYMAPEQATGRRVDHRVDVYAVGALLYEAVTGRRAFDDSDPIATLAAVLTQEPPRPCSLNEDLPPALELVIQKAMAKKRQERYRSMRELDAALAELEALGDSADSRSLLTMPFGERTARVSLPNVTLPAPIARWWGKESIQLDDTRTALLAVSVAAVLTTFLALVDVTTSVVRLSRGAIRLTGSEIVLATLGSAGLLVAPTVLWGRFVLEHVWPSTPRVIHTSAKVGRTLFASLAMYALGMLLVRVFAGALRPEPSGSAWPGWDVLVFLATAATAGYATWQEHRAREVSEG